MDRENYSLTLLWPKGGSNPIPTSVYAMMNAERLYFGKALPTVLTGKPAILALHRFYRGRQQTWHRWLEQRFLEEKKKHYDKINIIPK
jgi:hypothetical protein